MLVVSFNVNLNLKVVMSGCRGKACLGEVKVGFLAGRIVVGFRRYIMRGDQTMNLVKDVWYMMCV